MRAIREMSKFFCIFASALLTVGLLSSCKGRRTSDVTPTGDTVEVTVSTEAPTAEDGTEVEEVSVTDANPESDSNILNENEI